MPPVTWNVWDLRQRLGMVSHDLQARHLGNPIGQHVILSGFYSSIGIAAHHDYTQGQIDHAEGIRCTLALFGVKIQLAASQGL